MSFGSPNSTESPEEVAPRLNSFLSPHPKAGHCADDQDHLAGDVHLVRGLGHKPGAIRVENVLTAVNEVCNVQYKIVVLRLRDHP